MMTAKKREQKKQAKNLTDLGLTLQLGKSPQNSVQRPYDVVKVFSATKARDREMLAFRATAFLRAFSGSCVGKVVRLSSDQEFHCLTLIFFMKRD